MWSSTDITTHFILNWTLKSAALACKGFQGSHTAISIYHEYPDVMNTMKSMIRSHITITSAANMLKAFQGEHCLLNLPGYPKDARPSADDSD